MSRGRNRVQGRSRKKNHAPIKTIPERIEELRKAFIAYGGGAALIVIGLGIGIALATHSISDPSFSVATSRRATNLLGSFGSTLSDALLQSVGGAAWCLAALSIAWGGFAIACGPSGLPEKTPVMAWVRFSATPFAIVLLAGAAAIAPVPETWPFISGVGGFVGDGLLNESASLLGLQKNSMPIAILIGVLGTCIYVFALGLSLDRLNEAGRVAARYFDRLLDALDRVPLTVPDSITEKLPAAWLDKTSQNEVVVAREEPAVAVEEIDDDDEVEEEVEDFEDEYDELEDDTSPTRNIIRAKMSKKKSKREASEAQPRFPIFSAGDYQLPALNFFAKPPAVKAETVTDEALEKNARMLETVLADFNVRGEIINVRPGPVVTLYELEPAAGVKSSRVIGLADDIARSMSAIAARVAVIPGRNAIGIELPNQSRETVFIREMLGAPAYENSRGDLTLALGKSIGGEPIFADLSRMPHLLIAGTTGSGKSVGINGMILSLLYRLAPDQCKLIMIDPKMLELSVYEGIPHLLSPVVTDPRKAVVALKWTVKEMEERYRRMSKVGVRNITGFNQRVEEAAENGETLSRTVHTGYDEETGEPVYETEELDYETMPFIVVIIDEVADLMMVAGKDIEAMVQRLAQMARAAGIHLIMATQRPSVDVITGTIKANFPTRISFQVTSKIDSRTILGEQGAEQLLGQGDMLHMAGGGRITRVHGAFVSDDEVEKVVDHLKKQGKPDYVQEVTEMGDDEESAIAGLDIGGNTSSGDALYDKAVAVVMRDRKASTSYIQRRLQIGYNRAATLIERMEDEGVVSSANHAGKRQILVGEDAA